MTDHEHAALTVSTAGQGLREGRFSAADLEAASRARLNVVEPKVHAMLRETPELSTAAAIDALQKAGQPLPSPLSGVPVAIKDNLATAGVETTAGSKILSGYRPVRDATAVARLRAAGANIVAKTNLDEFGMGASTENSAFGPTMNPYDLRRVPGGSSGGSAAAVADASCLAALGTDTGGSVRHPAAFCGVVGLKPGYGRVSRFGLIALTSSTDVVGILTKTVSDAATVLGVIAGRDPDDATTVDAPVPDYRAQLGDSVRGLRIGVPQEYFRQGIEPGVEKAVRTAIAELESLGAKVESCSLPSTDLALWVYYIITPAEASTNLARYDGIRYPRVQGVGHRALGAVNREQGIGNQGEGTLIARYAATRGEGFGPEPKRRILLGTYALSAGYYEAYYNKAQRVRRIIVEEFNRAFSRFDVLATPTTPTVAFPLGAKPDPLAMYLCDVCLTAASLAGLPAISVPCGVADSLPVGLQLIGRPFDEATVLRVAAQYEAQRGQLPLTLAV